MSLCRFWCKYGYKYECACFGTCSSAYTDVCVNVLYLHECMDVCKLVYMYGHMYVCMWEFKSSYVHV